LTGIDGAVELAAELERLSHTSEVAHEARRDKSLCAYLAARTGQPGRPLGISSSGISVS
jgi:hypothetical protein